MKSLLFVAAFLAMALAAPQEQAASGPNAEAEADPWYGYYGYAHRPYGYGYYGGYYGHRYGYYGKRSADEAAPAESGPNANAEADPWYGYYGSYGYRPYGYGYHGLGYRGYYWG